MFGEPILPTLDQNTVILRPHWQYHIKQCGTRRAHLCCNGSKYTAPLLHELALTYSTCVEHPIQRLFFAIEANLNLKYRDDAKDAFAYSPGPKMNKHLAIDDAYAEWYEQISFRTGHKPNPCAPYQKSPSRASRIWTAVGDTYNKILQSPELAFKTTTHDHAIYSFFERVFLKFLFTKKLFYSVDFYVVFLLRK